MNIDYISVLGIPKNHYAVILILMGYIKPNDNSITRSQIENAVSAIYMTAKHKEQRILEVIVSLSNYKILLFTSDGIILNPKICFAQYEDEALQIAQ